MSQSKISEYQYNHETRISLLEQSIVNINETLKRFEQRFDRIDERLDRIDEKFDKKFDSLNFKIDSNLKWMLSFIFITSTGLLGVMAHGFHWI